jgi:hypothetical protein
VKECTVCKIAKELSEFNKRKLSKDGLQPLCKPCQNKKDHARYLKNPKKKIDQANAYRKNNTESYNAYRRKLQAHKEATDINYKLRRRLRSRLYNALKGAFKAGSSVELLGCTIPELRQHIEAQFEPGMTWDNWGQWHIDHIRPLVAFNLVVPEELAKACHYTNLRPLWGEENMSLGAKARFDIPQQDQ